MNNTHIYDFYSPTSGKRREFLQRPVPQAKQSSVSEQDDSWIFDTNSEVPIIQRSKHQNKGGRPKGSTKKRIPTIHTLKVSTQQAAQSAVLDILWRAKKNSELTGKPLDRKLTAKQIVIQIELSGNITTKQVYGIINRMVREGRVEYDCSYPYSRNGKQFRKELMWLDSKRVGWYWQGELWSIHSLIRHRSCKISKMALWKRLNVQGLSVDEALIIPRTDNASTTPKTSLEEEWTVI